jgi:acyl carrier protein
MFPALPHAAPLRPATREAFAKALCEFINHELPSRHPKIRREPGVSFDTPLFAQGLIDSMAILHVIAFVEDLSGQPIPTEKVVMKHFQTVAAITESFGPAA